MDRIIKSYKSILTLGLIIVIISFFIGILRMYNQSYLDSIVNEEILRAFTEIIPLFGLGILKLGIGFAIVTIVQNLRATGENATKSFAKTGMKLPKAKSPSLARIFPKLLVLGIIIEIIAVFIAIGWMVAVAEIIDMKLLHTFEVLAEPLEGLGVSLLIGGIALGLATIVQLLSKQATFLPAKLSELVSGKKQETINTQELFPKWILAITILGMIITATGFLHIAFIRLSTDIWHPLWENWMFVGIGIMLFSIALWLLTIIKWLRAQRENLGKTLSKATKAKISPIEAPLSITRYVKILAAFGLIWMILFFGFAWLGANGSIGQFGPLVRPGKAIGMTMIFVGIGASLVTIVVNLKFTAFLLPGTFGKITRVIKGEKIEDTKNMPMANPMAYAPKKLYLGIILGMIIAVLGTFPLATIRVIVGPTDPLFLIVERIIGTTVALGVGTIFFFIGMFFNSIVTFVKGRRTMISEGVETITFYVSEKTQDKSTSP
jgi:hypothetical protein